MPNHHRDIGNYPIIREKVDALKASFKQTGFWGNIVARKNGKGYEIAYGHHRLVALKESYKPSTVVPIIVRSISDDHMLKMMAQENMEEWGSSAFVELQTVAAVVEAYGRGEIELESVGNWDEEKGRFVCRHGVKLVNIRWAPSYIEGLGKTSSPDLTWSLGYTPGTVAKFLGWTQKATSEEPTRANHKTRTYLIALELIELGVMKRTLFKDLTTAQANATVLWTLKAQVRHVKSAIQKAKAAKEADKAAKKAATSKERKDLENLAKRLREEAKQHEKDGREEASRVGKHLAKEFASGELTISKAGSAAWDVMTKETIDPMPPLAKFVPTLCQRIVRLFDKRDGTVKRLLEVAKFKGHLEDKQRKALVGELTSLIDRIKKIRKRLS